MTAAILVEYRHTGPFGLWGSEPREVGANGVERASGIRVTLDYADEVKVDAGGVFILHTPWGWRVCKIISPKDFYLLAIPICCLQTLARAGIDLPALRNHIHN